MSSRRRAMARKSSWIRRNSDLNSCETKLLQGSEQLGHVLANFTQHLVARFLCRACNSADNRGTHDQTIGHRCEQPHVFWLADAEADADRQVGLRPEPSDVINELRRQHGAFTSDACDRHI